ncbi:BRO1-like domain-containing protein [Calycina marina]|uniref:BRO domain-containing protein 1 n=1 Tax=Calycina marina TaxID=1763456 RepID=A0A9P8CKD6_9HELO|nr:BRO1-like domain-containing protein [Calycina marina]
MQAPMISTPLKATNEIDWIQPLKGYIRQTYGDDPERYAEECATLNRLRQDIRGAGKDSAAGRDLLYRYYGQLELLDLRFPVDENHIKISFTWFDAFTHKPTSQYSLAYEKASIIFNISAVLSCHASFQTRSEDSGLKTAYHSFQASAGMFTYINENFLHAPSTDLSRDTVKTLIQIMLAQGQEVFLEKQIADGKKVGLLAKLASQAAYLYSQAVEGTQDNVNKAIFEKVWLLVVQIKSNYMNSVAQYYQALADDDANSHGTAIARLQVAEISAKDANKLASSFPGTIPANSNLTAETGATLTEITKRHLTSVQDKLSELIKDNDYIYHQTIPADAALSVVPKLPAAKAIPVSELYAGQDIQRITGPDIFAKIVPISVTESASLYDEEKAKLVRAETERVETANSEMAASLDYLRLPSALQMLKGGFSQELAADEEFRGWCDTVANRDAPGPVFSYLDSSKQNIFKVLEKSSKQLDMEESVCEKMRSKYEGDWTQQPSSRLTSTLRNDIRNYRDALEEASHSDGQLYSKFRQYQSDFEEMRHASETGESDVLFQKALIQFGGGSRSGMSPAAEGGDLLGDDFHEGLSVEDQVAKVEDILKKLHLIKRERAQVLKDLKEKAHQDDISQVLILNKKSTSNYETELFQAELEKYRPHQNRLLSANHKQASLMKELISTFNALLKDKRVSREQRKHESISRQRSIVNNKYKKIHQEFLDLEAGLDSAKGWYREIKDTVDSLDKNVETFVNNRRSEGAQLLSQIEQERAANSIGQADQERERLKGLMERMSMDPKSPSRSRSQSISQNSTSPSARYPSTNINGQYQIPTALPPPQANTHAQASYTSFSPAPTVSQQPPQAHRQDSYSNANTQSTYNPGTYQSRASLASPPPEQTHFAQNFLRRDSGQPSSAPPTQTQFHQNQYGRPNQPISPPPTQTQFHQNQYGRTQPTSPPPTQTQFSQYGRQSQQPSQQQWLPQGYVPPPPPPGPPPLGPQQTFQQPGVAPVHGHGEYGYENPNQQRGGQQQQSSGDPWAGLNAWK